MLQNLVVEHEKLADPRLPACSRKAGFLLETCCTIMDAKGVSVMSMPSVYGYLQQASAISQNYYPERLGKLYVINAPFGFSSAFSFVKKFLDPVTVSKIHILGTNYQKELLAQIPKENLPKILGGLCECKGSCMLSDEGPWQEKEWAKPAKWAKSDDKALDPSSVSGGGVEESAPVPESSGNADAETETKAEDKAPATS
jgi:hypothetical protein